MSRTAHKTLMPRRSEPFFWTEDSRLHTAGGERNFKLTSPRISMSQNAFTFNTVQSVPPLVYPTLYASPLITVTKHGYTKHYFEDKLSHDMQNSKTEHVCDLKVITNRYQSGPVVSFKGISFLFALYNLYLFALIKIKRIKKAEVFKCRICGRYEWKCPYCNSVEVLDTVPRLHKCKGCDKNSYFDPYLNSFVHFFQNGKKP